MTGDVGDRWLVWYRFARDELDYSHREAVTYANVRVVEELNRERLGGRYAA
jgi:hypothetical protein